MKKSFNEIITLKININASIVEVEIDTDTTEDTINSFLILLGYKGYAIK